MGIEELINEYKKQIENNMKYIKGEWACEADRISGMKIAVDVLRRIVEDLQQLKSSLPTQLDKVVVPELIHKWIKHVKGLKWGLADLLNPSVSNSYLARDAKEWLEKDKIHAEILARAWLEDDYTVEKEQLYYVQLAENLIFLENIGNKTTSEKYATGTKFYDRYVYKGKFTEQEIEAMDERYWAFAVPVEEDEK